MKDKVCLPHCLLATTEQSSWQHQLFITETVLGTSFGVIIGPYCANWFNPHAWGTSPEDKNRITLEIVRLVLATGLFAIGVELPRDYLAKHVRSLVILVSNHSIRERAT